MKLLLTKIMKSTLGVDGGRAGAGASGEIDVGRVFGCHNANDVAAKGATRHEGVAPLLHRWQLFR